MLHEQFSKQVLPFPGSLMDQPNHVIEIFRLLDSLKLEHQEKQERANRARNK